MTSRIYTRTIFCVYPQEKGPQVPYYTSTDKEKAKAKAAGFRKRGIKVRLKKEVQKLEDGGKL